MYPFRAVEHRVAIVRAANTGVSAFIAPTGQIVQSTALYERTTLTERMPLRTRDTVYARFGDWLAYLALAVSGASLAARAGLRAA
jgi:apolipoprotein N-acyltransferase